MKLLTIALLTANLFASDLIGGGGSKYFIVDNSSKTETYNIFGELLPNGKPSKLNELDSLILSNGEIISIEQIKESLTTTGKAPKKIRSTFKYLSGDGGTAGGGG